MLSTISSLSPLRLTEDPEIERMREEKIAQINRQEEPQAECALCLELLKSGEILQLLPCGHIFHRACLSLSVDTQILENERFFMFIRFNFKLRCPLCRAVPDKVIYISHNDNDSKDLEFTHDEYIEGYTQLRNEPLTDEIVDAFIAERARVNAEEIASLQALRDEPPQYNSPPRPNIQRAARSPPTQRQLNFIAYEAARARFRIKRRIAMILLGTLTAATVVQGVNLYNAVQTMNAEGYIAENDPATNFFNPDGGKSRKLKKSKKAKKTRKRRKVRKH